PALADVGQDEDRIALLRRAEATAAAGAEADDVAGLQLDRRLRPERPGLVAREEDVLGALPGQPALDPPRSRAVAVGQDRERRLLREKVVAAQAEAAAPAARSLRVVDQLVAGDPHRVVGLDLLNRRVLGVLAVRLDRVGPVLMPSGAVAAG